MYIVIEFQSLLFVEITKTEFVLRYLEDILHLNLMKKRRMIFLLHIVQTLARGILWIT